MKQLKRVQGQMYTLLRLCFFNPDKKRLNDFISAYTNPEDPSKSLFAWSDAHCGIIAIDRLGETVSEISAIAVLPEYRNKSIGRSMIMVVLKENNCRTLIAETDDEAVQFYEKCGFRTESLGEKYPGVTRYKCVMDNPFL